MVQTVDLGEFKKAFEDFKRVGGASSFTYAGLEKLYEYLVEAEEDSGEKMELDVIALCCEFNQISLEDIKEMTGCGDIKELEDHTTVIVVDEDQLIYRSVMLLAKRIEKQIAVFKVQEAPHIGPNGRYELGSRVKVDGLQPLLLDRYGSRIITEGEIYDMILERAMAQHFYMYEKRW